MVANAVDHRNVARIKWTAHRPYGCSRWTPKRAAVAEYEKEAWAGWSQLDGMTVWNGHRPADRRRAVAALCGCSALFLTVCIMDDTSKIVREVKVASDLKLCCP